MFPKYATFQQVCCRSRQFRMLLRPLETNLFTKHAHTEASALPVKTEEFLDENFDLEDLHLKIHNKQAGQYIPTSLLGKNYKNLQKLYLFDRNDARNMFKKIEDKLKQWSHLEVIETSPGVGLFTKHLLKVFNTVHCFEQEESFAKLMRKRFENNNVNVVEKNLEAMWRLFYVDDSADENEVGQTFKFLKQPLDWSDEPNVVIVGCLAKLDLIHFYVWSIIFGKDIIQFGRPVMYVLMIPFNYEKLTATPQSPKLLYRWRHVLFQLFFDIKIISKLPRSSFLPPISERKMQRKQISETSFDPTKVYLVEIIGKKHLPFRGAEMVQFWYFLQQCLQNTSRPLIPMFEQWIPNCGEALILKGEEILKCHDCPPLKLTIHTQMGELYPTQFLNLFNYFSKLPEYGDSTFLVSMHAALQKYKRTHHLAEVDEVISDIGEVDDDHVDDNDDVKR